MTKNRVLVVLAAISFVLAARLAGMHQSSLVIQDRSSDKQPQVQLAAPGTVQLAYVDSDGSESTVWSLTPATGAREKLLTVGHANGYQIKASADPAGIFLAYTALADGTEPAFKGSLWMARIHGESPPFLTDDRVDYGWTPKWSPRGSQFIYEKKILLPNTGPADRYYNQLAVGDASGKTRVVYSDFASLELVPIGWSANGESVFVDRIFPEGDSLYVIDVRSGTARSLVAHLTDTAAAYLELSPNGRQIVASILVNRTVPSYALITVSTKDGHIDQILAGASQHYRAAWGTDDSSLLTFERGSFIRHNTPSTGQVTAPRELVKIQLSGTQPRVLAPLGSSPDGQWVALRAYYASSDRLFLWHQGTGSDLISVPSGHWVEFVGWINR